MLFRFSGSTRSHRGRGILLITTFHRTSRSVDCLVYFAQRMQVVSSRTELRMSVLSRDARGRYARWEACASVRSDRWICRCRASLARQRDYRPRSCWTVGIVSGKPPALYLTCRQATYLSTTQHTGYIFALVAAQTQTLSDELRAQALQSQTQHERIPKLHSASAIPSRVSRPAPLA